MIGTRRATLADVHMVQPLFSRYRVWYKMAAAPQAELDFLTRRLGGNESIVIVAEHKADKKLLGFTQLYPVFSSTRLGRLWLLNDLYVEEEWRGQGVGRLLIKAAQELAGETEAVGLLLETQKTNVAGNALYQATGFELEAGSNFYEW
ncbi:acyl-CoA N-acyltransferase, partial [Haematococcus lacustris]